MVNVGSKRSKYDENDVIQTGFEVVVMVSSHSHYTSMRSSGWRRKMRGKGGETTSSQNEEDEDVEKKMRRRRGRRISLRCGRRRMHVEMRWRRLFSPPQLFGEFG